MFRRQRLTTIPPAGREGLRHPHPLPPRLAGRPARTRPDRRSLAGRVPCAFVEQAGARPLRSPPV
ncbi:MAG: hypothetical protein MZV64_48540 [Ignavibacteriales bacterium]|nr:hypothetical protein [Ignavibacteriales bacterium]